MSDQPKFENSIFHDLGSHLANAYQEFLDSRKQYGDAQQTQGGGTNALPDTSEPLPTSEPIQVANSPMPEPVQDTSTVPTPTQPQITQQPMGSIDKQGMQANQAANQVANIAQDVGQKEQGIYDEGLQRQKDLTDATYKSFQENHAKDQALIQAYQSNQIDPNHVISNMTTGSKIMASLGLIFSGLGSGLTGQRNMAMDVINNAISRDLEAQKANSEVSYNAYRMHREGTQDEMSADIQHQKDNMLAINAAIEQQASRMKSPQAVLAARQTQLALSGQIMDLNQKQAMIDGMKQLSKSGNSAGLINNDRWNALEMSGLLKGEDETAATKEATSYNEAESLRKDMEQSAKHLANVPLAGALHPSDRQSAINAFAGRIAKVGEGRFNLEESKLQAQALLPSPLDSSSTIENKAQRRQAFFDSLAHTPTLIRFSLKNAPQEVPQYKTVNGVKYMRGPNGEAIKVQ